jgi:cytochrome c-type biogenesis protein CcmI
MSALLIGAALAVAALAYVLIPLFEAVAPARPRGPARPAEGPETAIDALREIEFDRATGKLSDDDYAALKTEYTRTALIEMRAGESSDPLRGANAGALVSAGTLGLPNVDGVDATDPAEAAVLRYRAMRRACDTCGPRPEPDPAFCSSCGKYLRGACAHCGATIDQPASRFCANCGSSLAA